MPSSENSQTPPPSGWQARADGAQAGADSADLVARFADLFGEFVPEDLQRRLAEAVRELLVALRALIDWLVERLEGRHGGGGAAEVRDIPIL